MTTADPDSNLIVHIAQRDAWQTALTAGEYRTDSLLTEGFIHCSTPEQVVATAQRLFAGRADLLLLCIDPARLPANVHLHYEAASDGGVFPHVYGGLTVGAVIKVVDFPCQTDGGFALPELPRRVQVEGTNYDEAPHWRHAAWLLESGAGVVITSTAADLQIETEAGTFISPFHTRGHYWPDRWYNVIRLEQPGQGLFGYYCNIATPLRFDGEAVRYADLQLDVRVYLESDGRLTCELCDEDEFEAARGRYAYSDELVQSCRDAVDQILAAVATRAFPFDN